MEKKWSQFIIILILFIVIVIRLFIISPIKVSGLSMYKTYDDGDILLLTKIGYEIKRFDLVVINRNGELIIKRVIGLPGERLEYKDNQLYIDDARVDEEYLDEFEYTDDIIVEIPNDSYFVLGDNRDISRDSRDFGSVHKKQIVGKIIMKIYPFNK